MNLDASAAPLITDDNATPGYDSSILNNPADDTDPRLEDDSMLNDPADDTDPRLEDDSMLNNTADDTADDTGPILRLEDDTLNDTADDTDPRLEDDYEKENRVLPKDLSSVIKDSDKDVAYGEYYDKTSSFDGSVVTDAVESIAHGAGLLNDIFQSDGHSVEERQDNGTRASYQAAPVASEDEGPDSDAMAEHHAVRDLEEQDSDEFDQDLRRRVEDMMESTPQAQIFAVEDNDLPAADGSQVDCDPGSAKEEEAAAINKHTNLDSGNPISSDFPGYNKPRASLSQHKQPVRASADAINLGDTECDSDQLHQPDTGMSDTRGSSSPQAPVGLGLSDDNHSMVGSVPGQDDKPESDSGHVPYHSDGYSSAGNPENELHDSSESDQGELLEPVGQCARGFTEPLASDEEINVDFNEEWT
ncbi:hypothetical protein EDC01DRAFT_780053 [Geopyxis carbonaria]|nr:hypothetical protein EDC01DRAFT_780053 [Geopyxis carbonaria]